MKKSVSIIGGGPSALMLASFLDQHKFKITIYEKNKTVGRKFLVAGKGGFNLTHSEPTEQFINRYTPNDFLKDSLLNFTNNDFRNWLAEIGILTFIGSSKRVYPKEGIKPIEVLNTILNFLTKRGVIIKYEHLFSNWTNNNHPIINNKAMVTDYIVFSLGGGSWKVTGSDGSWLETFKNKGVKTIPFQASNCGYKIDWKQEFLQKNEGKWLKNIAISCLEKTQKGEAVITAFGLEGNAIYGLSPQIRNQLKKHKKAIIYIDLKPSLTFENVLSKIVSSNQKNTFQILKKELKLSTVQIDLLKNYLSKEFYLNSNLLAKKIKEFPIEVIDFAPIDEAISTVGGIDINAIGKNFNLKNLPNQFCIGEMLNWDAPTGGYLLQACVSSGVFLAKHLNSIE